MKEVKMGMEGRGVMKEVKMGMEGRGVRFLEDGRMEIAWPLLFRLLGSM